MRRRAMRWPAARSDERVDVSGTITEFNGLTEITFATVTITSNGNPLPTPVEFNASVPSPDPHNPTCVTAGSNFECFEFMRVRIADGLVSTGNQRFGSPATETYAEVFVTANGRRGIREPGLLYPLTTTAGNIAAGQWDGNPELFEIDADYFGGVPQDTVTFLVRQQCAAGGFRLYPDTANGPSPSCDEQPGATLDVDSTAMAVQALLTINTQTVHASLVENISPYNLAARNPQLAEQLASHAGTVALNLEITRQAAMVAYIDDFKLMAIVTVCALPLLLFVRARTRRGSPSEPHLAIE